jgi:hypothetical protein
MRTQSLNTQMDPYSVVFFMTHHYSGPNFGFPRGDARVDFTDLFAFPKPGDANKSIIIINTHPSHGLNPKKPFNQQEPTTNEPYAPKGLYELRVDTNGDMVAEIAYRVHFNYNENGMMTATVRRAEGAEVAKKSDEGEVIFQGSPISMGSEAKVSESGAYRLYVGWRSDPFFFDVDGVLNNMQFTGTDWFADKDVCSIALEVPVSELGGGVRLNLWVRTFLQVDGAWVQADRGARPSQTPFMAEAQREAYLDGEPAQDERFVPMFAHILEQTGGYTQKGAEAAARSLLPDVLPYDPMKEAAYPANGRKPTDDGKGLFLTVFNGRLTSDRTGPHSDILYEFPYLGAPHIQRTFSAKMPQSKSIVEPVRWIFHGSNIWVTCIFLKIFIDKIISIDLSFFFCDDRICQLDTRRSVFKTEGETPIWYGKMSWVANWFPILVAIFFFLTVLLFIVGVIIVIVVLINVLTSE